MDKVTKFEIESLNPRAALLVDAAQLARDCAYAPYSKYFVGAAVLDENLNIHRGCNVENAAYTGTHAEAVAIGNMIVNGGTQIKAIACVTKDGGACCGDCRQHIWEMCNGDEDVPIYLMDENGDGVICTIGSLLPMAFELQKS